MYTCSICSLLRAARVLSQGLCLAPGTLVPVLATVNLDHLSVSAASARCRLAIVYRHAFFPLKACALKHFSLRSSTSAAGVGRVRRFQLMLLEALRCLDRTRS